MTQTNTKTLCEICGYQRQAEVCHVCGGQAQTLGKRGPLQVGRGNAIMDIVRGIMDVRRAAFALLFDREFIGKLRLPVAANIAGFAAILTMGWLWLMPAFEQSFRSHPEQTASEGPHLWLFAVWLAAGPVQGPHTGDSFPQVAIPYGLERALSYLGPFPAWQSAPRHP